MSQVWQLQTAKNKFSHVVTSAQQYGPQIITKHGVKTAVVLSFEDYRRLVTSRKKLSAFFSESPLAEVASELNLERDRSLPREEFKP